MGLALAVELGWRGIECILVERTDGAIHTPKMNEVNIRTMEHCRRWGIADAVRNCPFPQDYPLDIAFVTSLSGHELGRMPRPPKRDQTPPAIAPENFQICSQLWFDPIPRAYADSLPTVTMLHGCQLDSFEVVSDGVAAEMTYLDDGERGRIHAGYLAACDGANSAIRRSFGIELAGSDVLGRPVHMFFRAPDLLQRMGKRPATFFLAVDRKGAWANMRIVDPANDFWRLMVLDTPADFDPDDIDHEGYLRRAMGQDYSVEWVGTSVWTRRGGVAERYRDGPIFLVGDSAHQLSPTGALGMNTGIGDAVDLGWKLAAVLDGWGGPNLLDSYDAERRPVGVRNVTMATEFHGDHLAFEALDWIEDDTGEADAKRRELGERLVQEVGRMFRTDGLQIGYRYDDSPICKPDGTPASADDPEDYKPTARPGSRAPHAWLADGRSALDLFGRGFILLRFGADAPDPVALVRAGASRAVPLEVVTIDDRDIAKLYQRRLALVRPDGHVAWRADAVPADPASLIDLVRGARPVVTQAIGG